MKIVPFVGDRISLKHGSGGRAMRGLIQSVFLGDSPSAALATLDDGAVLPLGDQWLVLTTDSHVVHPRFFPGGDIGRLSISGTVNALAVMGATEVLGLTLAVVLEEGFPVAELERIMRSIRATCDEAGVAIVTGDTKVMGRGEVDGIVLNTAGVGVAPRVVPDNGLRPGDLIVVNGPIAEHGFAVMAARSDLGLQSTLRSDVAPLGELIRRALSVDGAVVAMKDPTRGGLASALHEMAEKSGVGVVLDEQAIPLSDEVRAVSELLGIDPLHVANEGKVVMGVRPEAVEAVLEALRSHPLGERAVVVGRAIAEHPGKVILDTGLGRRIVAELEGEPMPRIC